MKTDPIEPVEIDEELLELAAGGTGFGIDPMG
jgi:hypothetical protein